MNVYFTPRGFDEFLEWQAADPAVWAKLKELIREIRRSPFVGTGKPEPLRGEFRGWWSRRITAEHRIVYRVVGKGDDQRVEIAQCRGHY